MTNNQIKQDIEKRINKYGIVGAYKDMVLANAKCIKSQINNIPVFDLINSSHDFTIKTIKSMNMFNRFCQSVFYQGRDNVVNDEIYADIAKEIKKLV